MPRRHDHDYSRHNSYDDQYNRHNSFDDIYPRSSRRHGPPTLYSDLPAHHRRDTASPVFDGDIDWNSDPPSPDSLSFDEPYSSSPDQRRRFRDLFDCRRLRRNRHECTYCSGRHSEVNQRPRHEADSEFGSDVANSGGSPGEFFATRRQEQREPRARGGGDVEERRAEEALIWDMETSLEALRVMMDLGSLDERLATPPWRRRGGF
jgi:hypothetical protein